MVDTMDSPDERMACFCCGRHIAVGRKVKIRPWLSFDPAFGPDSAEYAAHEAQMTFRWQVICPGCYHTLESARCACARIAGQTFNMSLTSGLDRAATINQEKYEKWQYREALKRLGVDRPRES
jgi:hypothetical protein